jgi:hypothetical protein
VWEKFESLPAQTRPQRGAKPAIRLTALAHELASDGVLPDAGGKAHAAMHKFLDDFIAGHQYEFDKKRAAVATVEGRTIVAHLKSGEVSEKFFEEEADEAVVGDAFRRTARIISPDIARTYTMERAKRKPAAAAGLDDALIDAREEVSALYLMENLQAPFDAEATKLSDAWFAQYREKIKALPDDRQESYRLITSLSTEPQDVALVRPLSRMEPTEAIEQNGSATKFPSYKQHLLCDDAGLYPAELGAWETKVLEAEMKRDGSKCWYRNPKRATQDSLGIAYTKGGETQIVRPDFIFFAEQDGEIVADIVDPHGSHLADALPKLKGLASYAETHSTLYRRIEGVAEVGGKFRVLDLTRADVRKAVVDAEDATTLYKSAAAGDYA